MPHHPNGNVRILLCGYGHLGLALLEGLLDASEHCEVVGVFRWSSRSGQSQTWEPIEKDFQHRIAQIGTPDLSCKGMNSYDFITLLQKMKPDVVLVGSWGEILKKHILEQDAPIIINCHPSKLPAHRGANPYSSVIRQQEQETGVTFHRMSTEIDAGDIILQRIIPLSGLEDGGSVRDKCASTAQEMIAELVQLLKAHFIDGLPLPQHQQDHHQHSYFPQLKPEDGLLNWQENPHTLHRQMRALFPWIPCYSKLNGRQTVLFYDPKFVSSSTPTQATPGTILNFNRGLIQVATADPNLLLEVSSYQFSGFLGNSGNAYWPIWASPWLAPFLLRPGRRFTSHAN